MKRMLWFFLSVGCLVVAAVLVSTKTAIMPVFIFLSAMAWLFMAIALGGKKGFAIGAGILIFFGCIHSYAWVVATQAPRLAKMGYGDPLIFLGAIIGIVGSFWLPIKIGQWLLRKKEAEKEEAKEVSYGSTKIRKIARGRIGIG